MKRWEPLAPVDPDSLQPFAPPDRSPTLSRALAELPLLAAIAIGLTFLVKTFVAQAFFIPSASMDPQLEVGDRVVVSRVAYDLHDVNRGDVIVFDSPVARVDDEPGFPRNVVDEVLETIALKRPPDTELIKRVVALPGETVRADGGRVLVDGRPLVEPYLPVGTTTADFPPVQVPEGHVFVLGDNRSNSQDSRFIGPIPVESIVGRAIARVWPPWRIAFL